MSCGGFRVRYLPYCNMHICVDRKRTNGIEERMELTTGGILTCRYQVLSGFSDKLCLLKVPNIVITFRGKVKALQRKVLQHKIIREQIIRNMIKPKSEAIYIIYKKNKKIKKIQSEAVYRDARKNKNPERSSIKKIKIKRKSKSVKIKKSFKKNKKKFLKKMKSYDRSSEQREPCPDRGGVSPKRGARMGRNDQNQ